MAFGRGSMTKEMVGGKKAKPTKKAKKMAIGGMAGPMGAGPKMAPPGRGPMGPGAGMAPPQPSQERADKMAFVRGAGGMGAGPKMAPGGRGPMGPDPFVETMGAGPKMAPGGRNPMGPGAGMAPPASQEQADKAYAAFASGGMGAGPKMAPGGRGPMGGGIAGPTMVSPGRKPNDGFSQMMGGAMGMKKGGKVSASKKNSGGKVNLGDAMKQKVDAMGMKKGGKVGGRGDGVAVKGKTKGRMC